MLLRWCDRYRYKELIPQLWGWGERYAAPACHEEFDMLALADRTVEDAEIGDDASEGVEHRVEDQCLQRSVRIALRLRSWRVISRVNACRRP